MQYKKKWVWKKYGEFSSGLTDLKVCIQNSDTHSHPRVKVGARDKHWETISIYMVHRKVKTDRHRCYLK